MTITQLALVLLAAPAATAGAICLDKARGTLAHVMVTDLSDPEVVLGKLGARLVPVLNLVACALPVAALGTLLGGIDPMALTASILIAGGPGLPGVLLALALSVWLSKAARGDDGRLCRLGRLAAGPADLRDEHAGLVGPDWLKVANPFWLSLAPSNVPGTTSMVEPVGFLLACLLASAGLAALSVAKVRPVYIRQSGRTPKPVKGRRARRVVPPAGPVVARPVARQEPGPLARVAPQPAVEDDPDRLGPLHRADVGLQPHGDLGQVMRPAAGGSRDGGAAQRASRC